MAPIGDRDARRAVVASLDTTSFPSACVCCMASPAEWRDLEFGFEINKFLRAERPERIGPEYSVREVGHGLLRIGRVPYCAQHATEFDRRVSGAQSVVRHEEFTLHRGFEDRGVTFGFVIEPRGFVDYRAKDIVNPRTFKDFIFEFDNPDYAEAFRQQNMIVSQPTTAGGFVRDGAALLSRKSLREAGKARKARKLRKKGDIPALLAMLDDPNPETRFRAAGALNSLDDDRVSAAIDKFADLTEHDPDERVRRAALFRLGFQKDVRWLDTIVERTRDPSAATRRVAAEALPSFRGEQRAIDTLDAMLADPAVDCRVAAVQALGFLGAKEVLARAAKDENPVVAQAAKVWLGP